MILRCFFWLFSLLFLTFYVLLMPLDIVGYTFWTAESCLRVLLSDTVQRAVRCYVNERLVCIVILAYFGEVCQEI